MLEAGPWWKQGQVRDEVEWEAGRGASRWACLFGPPGAPEAAMRSH